MAFVHIETWVFDLDNTLYPPSARLFDQINAAMTTFITHALEIGRAEADQLRRDYWQRYGTTLAGLMRHHDIDPADFLAACHAIDLSALEPAPDLAAAIMALPGRRIIHTNGARAHAERVLAARGLSRAFHAIYGIEDTDHTPKPRGEAFRAVAQQSDLVPCRAAMVEDDARNLVVPAARGMTTVLVTAEREAQSRPGLRLGPRLGHIHHRTDDLTTFLRGVTAGA